MSDAIKPGDYIKMQYYGASTTCHGVAILLDENTTVVEYVLTSPYVSNDIQSASLDLVVIDPDPPVRLPQDIIDDITLAAIARDYCARALDSAESSLWAQVKRANKISEGVAS